LVTADWTAWLARWTEAGLIDADTAARIRAFERDHAHSTRLRWPIVVALAFGGLMLAGGVLLFVAAHWDALSPMQRFGLIVLLVAGFHVGGALIADRFHGMSVTLHGIGTVAFGAGIALAGQIFNLDEHWPGGIMMWAAGAAVGWAVLRQTPQLVLTALLAPAWLAGEWSVATTNLADYAAAPILGAGLLLLALTYLTAVRRSDDAPPRRALYWVGAVALLPLAVALAFAVAVSSGVRDYRPASSAFLRTIGWSVAIGLPLLLAYVLRGVGVWKNAVAAGWIIVLVVLGRLDADLAQYAWWAIGAIGLVAWGVGEGRSERVNMGAAIFAGAILVFYFSQVMDKIGRSASLIGLGLLFLAGGWALERVRRRLVQRAKGAA
jgi:uncharacterized membrane protein